MPFSDIRESYRNKSAAEFLFETLFFCSAAAGAAAIIAVFFFMIYTGLPLLRETRLLDILTSPWSPIDKQYGIFPMIAGTIFVSSLSVLIAFPFSFGCAAYISVTGSPSLMPLLKRIVHMMTGVPTVIYGFVGIFFLVPFIREFFNQGSGMCLLSASLMLSLLISPTMIIFFNESFDRIPSTWLHAVDALGGTKVDKLIHIIIPFSLRGIFTGVVLSFGRALGDTLIALMIAGNAVQTPSSLLDSVRTLTSHIALVIAADFESMEFKSIFICGSILYVLTAFIILLIRLMESKKDI